MKKTLLTIAVLICSITLYAQDFGLRAGADFASVKLKFEGESESNSETGFYVGFFGDFDISETFGIRPELNYISVDELNQLTIPVLARFSTSEKFHLLFGPDFGFILDSEASKSFNFGLDFGMAFNFSSNFAIEARYNLGLSNLIDDEFEDFLGGDMSMKLSAFVVGLAYAF